MVTAAAFFEVGDYLNGKGAFSGNAAPGEWSVQGVALHGVVGCGSSVMAGSKCGSGFLSAAFSQAALPIKGNDIISGTISSMIVGATASVLGGGKFANGAETAAFGYIFNCVLHECMAQGRDAERTFVGYLRTSGLADASNLDFNRYSDGNGNYFMGRPDIFSPTLQMVWDVKPDSIYGWASGAEQINRYTSSSGYDAGTAAPLFDGQSSIILSGSMNRYEFRYGGNGLVIYQALDSSPMERALQQLFVFHSGKKRDEFNDFGPKAAPLPLPIPSPIP